MNILVTGAGKNSFLGQTVKEVLPKYYQNYNFTFIGKEYDLTLKYDVERLFSSNDFYIVVHMAAKCGGILANKNTPATFIYDNVLMNTNIVDACHRFNIKYLITLGSVCMYPKYCNAPFDEEDIYDGKSEKTNHAYGESKKIMLTMQNAYRDQYNLKSCMLIPANMYGPYDHFDLTNSHVVPALINKFINAVDNNLDNVFCWGTGTATREFLYAEDCSIAIAHAIRYQPNIDIPLNIGTGMSVSIYDLSHIIAKLVGFKGKIVFTNEVSDGQPWRKLCVERAKDYLVFQAQTSLESGLTKAIQWYRETYKKPV